MDRSYPLYLPYLLSLVSEIRHPRFYRSRK